MKNIAGLFLGVCVLFSNILFATEFQINTYTTYGQSNASVASTGSNYLVTWHSPLQDGNYHGVYGQIVDSSGNTVGDEFRVNIYTTGDQLFSAVASNGTNYLVTWTDSKQDGSQDGVCGQIVDSSGNYVGSTFLVNTYTPTNQAYSAVASDGNNYLITWTSTGQDGDSYGVYGQVVNSIGGLVGSEFRVNSYTTSMQQNSSVASDGSNYLVTWQSNLQDGDGYGVYGRVVDSSGNTIGSEFLINTYTTSSQSIPMVGSSGSNYLVTWQSYLQDGNDYALYGQIVDSAGVLLDDEFLINTYTTVDQQDTSIAFDGTNYLVTWHSYLQDGDSYGVYGKFIDPSGVLLGDEFLINTYTTNAQYFPSVASDGTNYLVAWQSYGQDGSDMGIYGDIVAGLSGTNAIPEPASILLLVSTGLGLFIRRRK